MPTTPNFGITYPCMGPAIVTSDFSTFALTTEAALVAMAAEVAAATHTPFFRISSARAAAPAAGVEATLIFTLGTPDSSGITVNTATGTLTIITPGLYYATGAILGNQSTLTMTSQRVAVYLNGAFFGARKYRGSSPAIQGTLAGVFSVGMGPLAAGDVITFRYLWTGTGVISNPDVFSDVSLNYLSTP